MINYLISIFGEKNVSILDSDKLVYSKDASKLEEVPQAIVWPESKEQLNRLFRFASRTNVSIIPRGAGTGLRGGCIGKKAVIVDMSKWNKIVKVHVKEKWAEVQAGVVLDDLNNLLSAYGLYFPVIPSNHGVATIGGMISTNAYGIRVKEYGKMSNNVTKMEIIDGGARIFETEDKDIFGSEGNCAIILSAKIKLEKIPDSRSVNVFMFDAALDLVEKLEDLEFDRDVSAVEFIDKKTSSMLGFENKHQLVVEYLTDKGEVADVEEINKVWKTYESVYSTLVSKGHNVLEDPKVEVKKIPDLIVWLVKNNIPVFGSVLSGVLHPVFRKNQEWLIEKMYEEVKKMGGSLNGKYGIGIVKKDLISVEHLKELKKKYDVDNCLNKGKLE